MKNIILFALAAFICSTFSSAQSGEQDYTFAAGAVLGLPIGDVGSRYDYGYGAEIMYFKQLNKGFQIGGSIGYTTYIIDEELNEISPQNPVKRKDIRFLPIAVKGAYPIGDLGFGVGLDVGYAIGISENNNGGLLYEPKVTLETSKLLFTLGYRGIAMENERLHALQLGAAIKLN